MPCCVPECKLDSFAFELDDGDVVFEYGGDVFFWKAVLGVDYEETGFTASTVTDYDKLLFEIDDGSTRHLLDLTLAGRRIGEGGATVAAVHGGDVGRSVIVCRKAKVGSRGIELKTESREESVQGFSDYDVVSMCDDERFLWGTECREASWMLDTKRSNAGQRRSKEG